MDSIECPLTPVKSMDAFPMPQPMNAILLSRTSMTALPNENSQKTAYRVSPLFRRYNASAAAKLSSNTEFPKCVIAGQYPRSGSTSSVVNQQDEPGHTNITGQVQSQEPTTV